jgi:hypothetical protein
MTLCLRFSLVLVVFLIAGAFGLTRAQAPEQSPDKPLTSKEVVALVYQLPRHPEKREEIVEEIRKRGIDFPLTDGMRSLVATKSGNDALLRRTLDEAERRRVNPAGSSLPPEAEGNELLQLTRNVTLAAVDAMPDFLVRQIIKRDVAFGNTTNWIPQDTLSIAVSYRVNAGEQYKVLTKNGMPLGQEASATNEYSDYVGGTSSNGEYVTGLASLFKPRSQTEFKMVDTDTLRGRRTIVYEFVVQRANSDLMLKFHKDQETVVGSRGRVWVDRENNRVLRFEQIATEIPFGFPITAASSLIDYGWVNINEKPYLLPSQAYVQLTDIDGGQKMQSRNDIRFRDYQKFGAELKIIDEIDDEELPPDPKNARPPKPDPTKKPQ